MDKVSRPEESHDLRQAHADAHPRPYNNVDADALARAIEASVDCAQA